MPRYILVHSTASTNTYLSRMAMMLPSGTVVHTPEQTAGRGQRGNVWESESGKNVLFSMLLKKPALPVSKQFCMSEAVSLAVSDVLLQYAEGFTVKWPNDIYHADRKVCGMLIEHSVMGASINHSIIGVGVNVNQTEFSPEIPNPVSLTMVTGQEVSVEDVLHKVCEAVERRCAFESYTESDYAALHAEYLSRLYRNDGMLHKFSLPCGTEFMASIADVEPTGMLVLKDEEGKLSSYAFKEVNYII